MGYADVIVTCLSPILVDATQSELPGLAVYVYYRVPSVRRDAAWQAVSAMQARLVLAHPGLLARIMCRADNLADEGSETWMETYEHPRGVPHACLDSLTMLSSDLPAALPGPRHVEVFYPLAAADAGRPASP